MRNEYNNQFRQLADGLLSPQEFATLERAMLESPELRREYIRYVELDALLATELDSGSISPPATATTAQHNWLALGTAGLLAAAALWLMLYFSFAGSKDQLSVYQPSELEGLKVVAMVTNNSEDFDGHNVVSIGTGLKPGIVRIPRGRVEITFNGGAQLALQGPAELHLLSELEGTLLAGETRVEIPAEGSRFVLNSPYSSLVEKQSKFSLKVTASESLVTVHDGRLEVSRLGTGGNAYTSYTLLKDQRMRASAVDFELLESNENLGEAAALQPINRSVLTVTPSYVELIKSHKPLIYWRFEETAEAEAAGWIENTMSDQFRGEIALGSDPSAIELSKGVAHFNPSPTPRTIQLSSPMDNFVHNSFSIELWVCPQSGEWQTIFSVVPSEINSFQNHYLVLEYANQTMLVHPSNAFRFLYRNPAGRSSGMNLFTHGGWMPGEWHHLVAVKETGTLCLYHNGEKISSSGVGTLQLNDQVNYYLGQLRPQEGERQFCGEVDELAIYTYALTSEQIRQHYALIAPLDLPPNASTIFPSFH